MRPAFTGTLGVVGEYLTEQMDSGRIRRMHPIVAIQAVIGPVFFHLLSRPAVARMADLPMSTQEAVDELVAISLRGLK